MDRKYQMRSSNLFSIDPQSQIAPMSLNTSETVLLHECYTVYNIGRVPVYVTLTDSDNGLWFYKIQENKLFPGQYVTFDNVEKSCFVSGIIIYNREQERAFVQCSQADLVPVTIFQHNHWDKIKPMLYNKNMGEWKIDSYSMENYERASGIYTRNEDCPRVIEWMPPLVFDKEMYLVGVRYIPRMDEKFRGLYKAFWFSGKSNVWEEILLKLKPLISDTALETLSITISNYMRDLGHRIENLLRSFEEGRPNLKSYMEIVEQLSGFEKEFIAEKNVPLRTTNNMFLLPLYSNFIFMKIMFYSLCRLCLLDSGITYESITILRNDVGTTVRTATKYINEILDETLDLVYNTVSPEDIYNSMMAVRSYFSVHGTAYTGVWHTLIQVPHSCWFYGDFEPVLLYSNFFGRPTANLVREATCKQMYPPLTPRYIGLMYHTLRSIEVYLWTGNSSSGSEKIGGMKVTFSDHSSYIMGTKTEISEILDIGEAYITKLQVTGNGAVDSCAFSLSDGRELCFGTKEKDSDKEIFEMRGYGISSIFLSSDSEYFGGQAANIAVSYCSIKNWSW